VSESRSAFASPVKYKSAGGLKELHVSAVIFFFRSHQAGSQSRPSFCRHCPFLHSYPGISGSRTTSILSATMKAAKFAVA
jgi:hypothetical protein